MGRLDKLHHGDPRFHSFFEARSITGGGGASVGTDRGDLRLLAALPAAAGTTACGGAAKNNGKALIPVDATMVGLVWRKARRVLAHQAGVAQEEFKGTGPWQPQDTETGSARVTAAGGGGVAPTVQLSSIC